MNYKIILFSFLFAVTQSFAAQVKDVVFSCSKKSCNLTFRFANATDLPSYFQKYDEKTGKWTVAFAASEFSLGETSFVVDTASTLLKDVRVFKDSGRQGPLLKFEWTAGLALKSDKNPVLLKDANFSVTLPLVKAKSWKLSAIAAANKREAEKAAKLKAAEEKKAALEAEKAAKLKAAEEKDSAKVDTTKSSAVSALIDGVAEMTAFSGFGKNQFELKMLMPLDIEKVSFLEKKHAVIISMPGPTKSPVFKVNANSFVKSVTWTKDGLQISLLTGIHPTMIVNEGSLLLQTKETKLLNGYVYWKALPTGIHSKRWVMDKEEPVNIDSFVARYEKDSKRVISAAQAFFLTSVARELIVTAEEIELYETPSEESTVIARLAFGDILESVELIGLYQKVQYGPRTGYVNKRAVAFRDELSAIQTERLKQLAVEKGESLDSVNARFAALNNDDRVMYSSFGRRDPFVDVKGLVEDGINIDQVELVGIIWESDEPMAILSDVKTPSISYTIKEGDKVLNGKVLKITQTDVLFLIQEFGVSRRYSMGLPDKFGGNK
jgi:hypothetical protein